MIGLHWGNIGTVESIKETRIVDLREFGERVGRVWGLGDWGIGV